MKKYYVILNASGEIIALLEKGGLAQGTNFTMTCFKSALKEHYVAGEVEIKEEHKPDHLGVIKVEVTIEADGDTWDEVITLQPATLYNTY